MALASKFKKIFRMSFAEIRFRVAEQLRIKKEKSGAEAELKKVLAPEFNFFNNVSHFEKYQKGEIESLLAEPTFMRTISEPLNEARKRQFKTAFPNEYAASLQRADLFLQNKFAFLGVEFTLPDPIPWQSDPLSLNPYPQGFYRNINIFTNKNAGDIKHVWEVNRLQYLIEIAKAYYLSDADKYREKFDALVLDWDAKNPYKRGVAWASALEVGVRATALVWALQFYRSAKSPSPQVIKTILRLLWLSGAYLDENLSIYFSPYNHLIGETAGLFMVGYLFPGFKKASNWESKGWHVLEDQVEKQFHNDGASVEQATFYHHFTLGFYLQAMALKQINGESVSATVQNRVEKALEFAMYMTKPDGTLPYLGDIDDARSIYFRHPTNWNFLSYQTMGAIWFKRSDMAFVAQKYQEEAFWMLPAGEEEHFNNLTARAPEQKNIEFSESGYFIFRSGYGKKEHYAHMDCGPIAHGVFHDETPSAAHGHADLLAIELAAFGDSYLVDPGFSNYRGDFDWHCYFRSTAAHNTIEINGASQAKQGGILVWSHAPKFKLIGKEDNPFFNAVTAEHYGYHAQEESPVHRRTFAWIDNQFWVTIDEIYSTNGGTKKHTIKPHFHFNSGVRTDALDNGNRIMAHAANSCLEIVPIVRNGAHIILEKNEGGKNAHEGWIAPTYRAVTAAPVIAATIESTLPLQLVTFYIPNQAAAGGKFTLQNTGANYKLTNGETNYEIEINSNNENSVIITKSGAENSTFIYGQKAGVPKAN